MGIFTPMASDLDLALVAVGFVVIGLIVAYVVVPFAVCLAGTHSASGRGQRNERHATLYLGEVKQTVTMPEYANGGRFAGGGAAPQPPGC